LEKFPNPLIGAKRSKLSHKIPPVWGYLIESRNRGRSCGVGLFFLGKQNSSPYGLKRLQICLPRGRSADMAESVNAFSWIDDSLPIYHHCNLKDSPILRSTRRFAPGPCGIKARPAGFLLIALGARSGFTGPPGLFWGQWSDNGKDENSCPGAV